MPFNTFNIVIVSLFFYVGTKSFLHILFQLLFHCACVVLMHLCIFYCFITFLLFVLFHCYSPSQFLILCVDYSIAPIFYALHFFLWVAHLFLMQHTYFFLCLALTSPLCLLVLPLLLHQPNDWFYFFSLWLFLILESFASFFNSLLGLSI